VIKEIKTLSEEDIKDNDLIITDDGQLLSKSLMKSTKSKTNIIEGNNEGNN